MGLVLYALKYRVTFFVLSIVMLLGGIGSAVVTKKDVLPVVNIPVVVIVWQYTGLDTTDMASRVTTYTEYSLSNNVNNIARLESQTIQGYTVEKVWFDPQVSVDLAIAQVVSSVNSIRAVLPPGIQPPVVLRFSASSQPVVQLALSSATQSGAAMYDYAMYRIRQTLLSSPGATLPAPSGGSPRQIQVDLDLHALQANGLTPQDVANAVLNQNPIVPAGLAKMGNIQYPIRINTAPAEIADLNTIPVKVVDGIPIQVKDVAWVRDGSPPQQNLVVENGMGGVLMPIYKERHGVDADGRRQRQGGDADHPRRGAEGHRHQADLRSVGVRLGRHHRRHPRGGDRRLPDGPRNLHLPRVVALDARRPRVDPAVDPHLDVDPVDPRRDHQRHDARRPGARRRHPRRRRDGRHRETPTG